MVVAYSRPNGPKAFICGVLVNDAMKKGVIDRVSKATSTGMSADNVNVEVDNEALKSVVEGAVKGALGIP